MRLPRKRAVRNKFVAKDIEGAIKIQANPKLLKKIETASDKRVTLKETSNIKKNAKKGLLGIVALVIVVGIAYMLSSTEQLGITNVDLVQYDVPSTLKYAGTMIHSIYVLAIVAIVSMIYTEVAKIFK